MKKIAILTRRAGYNMGSTLQAYAMQRLVEKIGCEATIIDFDEYAHNWRWQVRPFLNRVAYKICKLLPFIIKPINKNFYLKTINAGTQRNRFDLFERQHFKLTDKKYRSSEEIAKDARSYDAFVCGSDQIWSPVMFDRTFYLDFIKKGDGIKKVAYAPSTACESADQLLNEQVSLIRDFDSISCREQQGCNALGDALGIRVPRVLDPTLMMSREDWDSLLQSDYTPPARKYLLCYFLHSRLNLNDAPDDEIRQIAERMGCEVLNISMHNLPQYLSVGKKLEGLNPEDFLHLIKGAEMVLTNSFHATVFSIIYGKRFYSFKRTEKSETGVDQNTRLKSLLDIVNLPERLVETFGFDPSSISYDIPDTNLENLEKEQITSMQFLSEALK